jgi:hypothetical protein
MWTATCTPCTASGASTTLNPTPATSTRRNTSRRERPFPTCSRAGPSPPLQRGRSSIAARVQAQKRTQAGGGGAYGASWGRCGRLFSRTSTAIYSHVLAGTHSRTSSFLPSISLSPSSLQAYTRLAKSLPPPPSFFHLHPSLSCPRHVAADIPIQSQSHTASLALPHL